MGAEQDFDGNLPMTSFGTTGDDYDSGTAEASKTADPYGLDEPSTPELSPEVTAPAAAVEKSLADAPADAVVEPDSPAKELLRSALPTDPASRRRAAAALLRSVLVVKRGSVR